MSYGKVRIAKNKHIALLFLLFGLFRAYCQSSVFFDSDSSRLSGAATKLLDSLSAENRSISYFSLRGYADKRGSRAHNEILVRERVNSVREYLQKVGISGDAILEVDGEIVYDSLLSDNLNRRVTIEKRWTIDSTVCGHIPSMFVRVLLPFPDDLTDVKLTNGATQVRREDKLGYVFRLPRHYDYRKLTFTACDGFLPYRTPLSDLEIIAEDRYGFTLAYPEKQKSALPDATSNNRKKGFWNWVRQIFGRREK